jgi:hypothetical protein
LSGAQFILSFSLLLRFFGGDDIRNAVKYALIRVLLPDLTFGTGHAMSLLKKVVPTTTCRKAPEVFHHLQHRLHVRTEQPERVQGG